MALSFETRKYRLIGTAPLLGSSPASKALRTEFISSKAPNPTMAEEEDEMLGNLDERGLTVFLRDAEEDYMLMLNYMIRGYFKGSLEAMVAQTGVKQPRSKVDRFLMVSPRKLPITRNGKKIYEEDSQLERPLRAETMKGPRVSLTASEMIDLPWEIEFEVMLLPNPTSKSSTALTWENVEDALEYGKFQGLGQWRTGGNGTFEWERID
jgi:hypothetical protein